MIWLDPAAWFWMPLFGGVAILALLPAARSREGAVTVCVLSLGCLAVSFVSTALWGWLLRDGLGPDMVESHGATAAWRFLQGGTGLALVGLACAGSLVSWVCVRRARRLPPAAG
jgi:hypothetical protein